MQNYKQSAVAAAALMILLLNGCAPSSTALKPGAVGEMIGGDLTKLYHQDEKQDGLKFEDAIARALRYNLDARVEAYEQLAAHGAVTLERLNALPAMEAKWNYITRSNKGAGSSLSVITNTQSLEPSISTPQSRTTAQLEMNWNLLDAALAVARSRSASDRALVAEERRRKVFQNVVQDVYSAYWRAAAAQSIKDDIAASVAETDVQIGKIDDGDETRYHHPFRRPPHQGRAAGEKAADEGSEQPAGARRYGAEGPDRPAAPRETDAGSGRCGMDGEGTPAQG